jgi:hypothetical protein
MSKPNWACSGCGMYSSRRWSVERHILNLHGRISNVVPFVDYFVGRKSGFYLPKFRPTFVKKNATKTVTVMDTFKNEFLKAVANKAVNKALSSSQMQNHQFDFQRLGSNGAPYFYPSQFHLKPSYIIPRPEDLFGFEIYTCKKCSNIQTVIVSFNDGKEGGSRINWSPCCDFASFSDLKKVDQKDMNDNNELQHKVQDKLKYCVKTWTNNKPMLTAIRIPDSFHGTLIKLLGEDDKQSISLEYSSEKNIELHIKDENHWAHNCIRTGTTALSHDDLADFLKKTENATFGFFIVKIKESNSIYLLAILSGIVSRSQKLFEKTSY